MKSWFATASLGVALLGAIPASASGQDTLSDSAWNADRVRRAATRAQTQSRLDSAARLVDTIVAVPAFVELRVGDHVAAGEFFMRFKWIGLRSNGDTVRVFSKTLAIKPGPFLEDLDNMLTARGAGVAEIWVRPGHDPRGDPFGASRPLTRVQVRIK